MKITPNPGVTPSPNPNTRRPHFTRITVNADSDAVQASCLCGWGYSPPADMTKTYKISLTIAHVRAHKKLTREIQDVMTTL
jgi:hypothetical protein